MKRYERPMAKMNEYTLIERLANLDDWLGSTGAAIGVAEGIEEFKTSYNMAS